jgi:hypothetical protein
MPVLAVTIAAHGHKLTAWRPSQIEHSCQIALVSLSAFLVTQRVANLTKGLVKVESIGELSLEGLRQPINGFRVMQFVNS